MIFTIDDATFEALRITGAVWTVSAGGETTLRVTVAGPLTGSPTWAAFQQVILKADAAEIFRGKLDQAPRRATGEEEGWEYIFTGPIRELDRKIYEQPLRGISYNPETGTTLVTYDPTGQVMLGWKTLTVGDELILSHATIREVLTEILDQTGLTYTLPEGGLTAQVPWEAREDDTCLAALRQILKWSPDLCLRWTGSALAIIRPDLEAPTLIEAATWDQQDIGFNPRYDLACESVTIKYLRTRNTPPRYDITLDAATGGIEGGRALIKSITLEGGEPAPTAGIAAEFLSWAGRIHIESQIGLRAINLARKPGDTFTVEGALGGLAGIPSVCQTITRDLIRHTETLALGVPRHLGLDDLIALKRKPYRRPDQGDSEQPEESGELEIAITGLPEGLAAKWSVGDQAGSGEATLTLAPGSYNVEFLPVYDFDTGTLYFAPSVSIELANEGTETATGAYEAVELAASNPFQIVDISAGETKKIKVRPSTIFEGDAVEISELTVTASGFVWVAVPFTPSTGTVGTGTLSYGSTIPDSTDSSYIVPIGAYNLSGETLTVANYRYGPITGFPCRDFYAEPVNWTLNIN